MNRTNAQANLGGKILQATNRSKKALLAICMKDCVFSAFMSRVKCQVPILTGKREKAKENSAILPIYTDTENFGWMIFVSTCKISLNVLGVLV